jgi:fission process protein 1
MTDLDGAEPAIAPKTDRTGDGKLHDPLVDNPALRAAGYAGRVGRLLGTFLAKGSRYVAYTSDVGEAFRPVVDVRYVRAGYAISWAYVLTDVSLQSHWARQRGDDPVRAGAHAAVFQSLGSMIVPALIIHSVVHQTEKVFHRMGRYQRWGPTSMGLAVVPFLPYIADRPIETAVDFCFDRFWPSDKPHHKPKHD